jgi:hypothetical protein
MTTGRSIFGKGPTVRGPSAGGGEGPWWVGSTVTVTGATDDTLVVWTDAGTPTISGAATATVDLITTGVYLVTWTADGEIVISPA